MSDSMSVHIREHHTDGPCLVNYITCHQYTLLKQVNNTYMHKPGLNIKTSHQAAGCLTVVGTCRDGEKEDLSFGTGPQEGRLEGTD